MEKNQKQIYEEDGIVTIIDPNLKMEKVEVTEEFKKGTPKSGKPWKKISERSNQSIQGLKKKWDVKQQIRAEKKDLKGKIKQYKDEVERISKIKSKSIKTKRKQKEFNEMKSASYQIIKNTGKIKKWNKKARAQLTKLPAELYEKLINKNQD